MKKKKKNPIFSILKQIGEIGIKKSLYVIQGFISNKFAGQTV